MFTPMISIIIPVLNEASNISKLLPHLTAIASETNIAQIIIVDGGSTDGTQEAITQFSVSSAFEILLLASEKGRAKQMNVGAKKATGDVLYFLHADSFPPNNFDTLILSEVTKGNPAGCFKMKFDSSHWWLRLVSWFTKFSWRACRGGDQSQFITRHLFYEIGGYDETYTIYEDNILINELYQREKFLVIQEWLQSSARLYEQKGVLYVQMHFFAIYIKRWLGADANELHNYYSKHIKQQCTSNLSEVKNETSFQPQEIFTEE